MRSSKDHRMFRFKGQPFHTAHDTGVGCTMIKLGASRNSCKKEGNAIMVKRRAPLTHGIVNHVENMICILDGWIGSR